MILVAGVGNVFLGDDGFGVAVVERLACRPQRGDVRVADFGIRGVHLAYELLDGYDALVLVDAMDTGDPPGTLVVLSPSDTDDARRDECLPGADIVTAPGAHDLTPDGVLAMLRRMGGEVGRVVVVGCQPATLEDGMGLSAPVAAAVDRAVDLVERLVAELAPAGRR